MAPLKNGPRYNIPNEIKNQYQIDKKRVLYYYENNK